MITNVVSVSGGTLRKQKSGLNTRATFKRKLENGMKRIEQSQLSEMLKLHKMWRRGEPGGVRANLSYSDLRDCDLSYSNLRGSDLSDSNLSDSNLSYSDLRDCDLRDCDLSRCDLSYSNLSGSDLSGSDLSDSNLSYSDLRDCDLSRCDLSYSNLSGSDLSGAKFSYKGVEAKRFAVFNNLYKYFVYAILGTDGKQYVRLGCKFLSRDDWDSGKGDNPSEFPDDGSEQSELRRFALATAFNWLDLIQSQESKQQQGAQT